MARGAPLAGFATVVKLIERSFAPAERLFSALARFIGDRRGNVTPLMALMVIPIVGSFGVVMETSNWYLNQRALQNAADAAAVAASTSAGTTTSSSCGSTAGTFDCEAKAALASYGLVSGLGTVDTANRTTTSVSTSWTTSNITVTATYSTSGCPGTASTCYTVTVAKVVPLSLSAIVGFRGNTTLNGGPAQRIYASAVASGPGAMTGYCLVGLGTSGNSITLSGGNGTDLTGCNMLSAGNLKCNGTNSDYGVVYGDAVGTSNCGTHPRGGQPAPDLSGYNYTTNASLLTASPYKNTCSAYHYLTDANFSSQSANNLSGTVDWSSSSVVQICGDLKISGTPTITTATGGTVLIIEGGQLNVPSAATLAASNLTVVFMAPSGNTNSHFMTGSGTLNFGAPSSGTWKGIAIYQDPAMTNSNYGSCSGNNASDLDMCAAGSSPSWYITGLVYAPNAAITVTGAINHQLNGYACFSMIAKSITISGTNSIFANPTGECNRAGLSLPGVPGTTSRLALVQ